MANIKCSCGYEPKFQAEFDALDMWGCAKAVVGSPGGFGKTVTLCSAGQIRDQAENLTPDPEAFQDKYKEMLDQKANPKKDASKKGS